MRHNLSEEYMRGDITNFKFSFNNFEKKHSSLENWQ